MTDPRRRLGAAAEELTAQRLSASGWSVLARNARTRYGEIDLIALDRRTLVFVEVKAGRSGTSFGPERAVLAVGPVKQRRLRRLAGDWLRCNGAPASTRGFRFDAVGVTYDREGRVLDFEHIVNAF